MKPDAWGSQYPVSGDWGCSEQHACRLQESGGVPLAEGSRFPGTCQCAAKSESGIPEILQWRSKASPVQKEESLQGFLYHEQRIREHPDGRKWDPASETGNLNPDPAPEG